MSDDDRAAIPGRGNGAPAPGPRSVSLGDQASLPASRADPAPDLIGMGFLDAHALAAASRLRISASVWETTVGPWGRVLDQRPLPGARIRRGGRIAITVSGRPLEQVPEVRGLPLGDAIERLEWLGFVPLADLRRASRSVAAGQVVSTRPPAGALLACGSVVALTVARSPREKTARPASTPPSVQ